MRLIVDFKTMHGVVIIGSLFVLPLWLYTSQFILLSAKLVEDTICYNLVTAVLVISRLLASIVEVNYSPFSWLSHLLVESELPTKYQNVVNAHPIKLP